MKISFQNRKSYFVVCSVTVTISFIFKQVYYIFVIGVHSNSCAILSSPLMLFVSSISITFVLVCDLSAPTFMIHLVIHFVQRGGTPLSHELCSFGALQTLDTLPPHYRTLTTCTLPPKSCALPLNLNLCTALLHTPSYPWQLLLVTV